MEIGIEYRAMATTAERGNVPDTYDRLDKGETFDTRGIRGGIKSAHRI